MSVNITINGVLYPFPETGDESWGDQVTDWAQAISSETLQKSAGSFVLTAELNFGGSFGIKLPYVKSSTANIGSTGVVRLSNTDSIVWRNAANDADLPLTVGADNAIDFNGIELVDVSTAQNVSNKTITSSTIDDTNTFEDNLESVKNLATQGVVVRVSDDVWTARTISGTTNEVDVTDGNGVNGNPTIGLADNPVVPGTGGLVLPLGTTGQRSGTPSNGTLRYNTTTSSVEAYANSSWGTFMQTPSTAAAVVGPFPVLLMTGSFSGLLNDINYSAKIGSYKTIIIRITELSTLGDINVLLRTSQDGTNFDSGANDYSYRTELKEHGSSTPTVDTDIDNDHVKLISGTTIQGGDLIITVHAPNSSTFPGRIGYDALIRAAGAAFQEISGSAERGAKILGIRLFSSPSTQLSGNYSVWGLL